MLASEQKRFSEATLPLPKSYCRTVAFPARDSIPRRCARPLAETLPALEFQPTGLPMIAADKMIFQDAGIGPDGHPLGEEKEQPRPLIVELPEPIDAAEFLATPIELPDQLVEGIL